MTQRRLISVLTLSVLATASIARADIAQLQAAADNTIYEDETGALANGAGQRMFVGSSEMNLRNLRGLIRFDFSSIPAGSTIDSVSLRLNMSRGPSSLTAISLHRVTQAWGEGTSAALGEEEAGAPATPGDATWLHAMSGSTSWAGIGGDFDEDPTSTALVGNVGFYTWASTPSFVSQVQAMLDGSSGNFGWMLLGDEQSPPPTYKRFDTRENVEVANRPVLSVTYTVPAPGAAGVMLAWGIGYLASARRRFARIERRS